MVVEDEVGDVTAGAAELAALSSASVLIRRIS